MPRKGGFSKCGKKRKICQGGKKSELLEARVWVRFRNQGGALKKGLAGERNMKCDKVIYLH